VGENWEGKIKGNIKKWIETIWSFIVNMCVYKKMLLNTNIYFIHKALDLYIQSTQLLTRFFNDNSY
jgi:hypothetical protein